MSHTLGIVGHVDRAAMVDALTATVRPDVVSVDDGTLGCEGNHRHVWSVLADDYPFSKWTVVLEDDAVPVDGFDVQLEAALKVAPTPVVSLYLGRTRPGNCQAAIRALVSGGNDAHWIVANRLLHGVGVAVRTSMVPRMLTWLERAPANGYPIDDAISHWAASHELPVAYTWPSLVDHADMPTVIIEHHDGAPRDARRKAWSIGVRERWSGACAHLTLPPIALV